eukprot:COSAG02_NODE_18535_length_933_cov_6.841085_1_plen_24_part_10
MFHQLLCVRDVALMVTSNAYPMNS